MGGGSQLACWAGQFTPRVSVAETGLLLEIGGCLRLFGGLDALCTQVTQGLAEQGMEVRIAVAATPQAALWLAEGQSSDLDALTITDLTWPKGVAEKLTRFGLRRLGEARRLTFSSLARRIGKDAATMIARESLEKSWPRLASAAPAGDLSFRAGVSRGPAIVVISPKAGAGAKTSRAPRSTVCQTQRASHTVATSMTPALTRKALHLPQRPAGRALRARAIVHTPDRPFARPLRGMGERLPGWTAARHRPCYRRFRCRRHRRTSPSRAGRPRVPCH